MSLDVKQFIRRVNKKMNGPHDWAIRHLICEICEEPSEIGAQDNYDINDGTEVFNCDICEKVTCDMCYFQETFDCKICKVSNLMLCDDCSKNVYRCNNPNCTLEICKSCVSDSLDYFRSLDYEFGYIVCIPCSETERYKDYLEPLHWTMENHENFSENIHTPIETFLDLAYKEEFDFPPELFELIARKTYTRLF